MKEDSSRERSILVPATQWILNLLSLVSTSHWIRRLMKKIGKWPDDELIPFWFNEMYVLVPLVLLSCAFWLVPVGSILWDVCLVLASYRLFELGVALASIFLLELERRRDEKGHYLLVRHGTRWVLLTLLNFVEIVLYFSFFYLTSGNLFTPPLTSRVGAIYQSLATFVTYSSSSPTSDGARIIIILHLGYFVFFLMVAVPIALSVIRAKERTTEELGQDVTPDKRI